MTSARTPLLGALLGLVLVSLTGCGGTSKTPRVARVPASVTSSAASEETTSSPATGTGTPNGDRRPVLRVDDSPERVASLWNAYNTCLLQNGARKPGSDEAVPAPGATEGGGPGVLVHQPVPQKAKAACLHVEPEGAPELEAATNPRFHEQSLAYVACLRDHGEYVRLLNDHNIDWTYEEGHPVPDNNGEIEDKCLVEAFGDN